MRYGNTTWLQTSVHITAFLPLALLIWDFTQGQLTANPIREIQLRTGKSALVLLILSLACTPLFILSGLNQILSLRRTLGLYAFMYACLHFLNFIGLDYGFDFSLIREDISEKRYALAGFAAFVILLPIAVTSRTAWKKRLGKNWKRLHRLTYAAALLVILHFLWQTKADFRQPLIYSGIVIALLVVRMPWLRDLIYGRVALMKRRQKDTSIADDI